MLISPWLLLVFAIPVLLLGDWLLKHVKILSRFHIPSPVVGGLAISILILLVNLSGRDLGFASKVTARWWRWLVTIGPVWVEGPFKGGNLPFVLGFVVCIVRNAGVVVLS